MHSHVGGSNAEGCCDRHFGLLLALLSAAGGEGRVTGVGYWSGQIVPAAIALPLTNSGNTHRIHSRKHTRIAGSTRLWDLLHELGRVDKVLAPEAC